MNPFPFGKAALGILILTVVSGLFLVLHPAEQSNATLTYWTFTREQYEAYKQVAPKFEREHPGVTVNFQLVSYYALAPRLQAAFLSDSDVPDLCELEIGSAGSMFRGPLKDIGFINLKPYLIRSGLYYRMVRARFSPYTSRGEIFGMPHDDHPEQIAYRKDIWDKYGVKASRIHTWADFVAAGRKVTIPGRQYMIELDDGDGTMLESFLFQEGGGYFNAQGQCTLDRPAAVRAMELYVPMVAGPDKIATSVGDSFGAQFAKALSTGYETSVMCPDWRSEMIQDTVTNVGGKMALMPLPAIAPGGIRTSTWGGTMCGITKRCKHPKLAFELLKFLYTDPAQTSKLFETTHIVPPIRDEWNMPVLNQRDPFFSNQRLGHTYVLLAPYVPARYTSPEITTATSELGLALVACVHYYNLHGADPGWDPFVRASLKKAADRVRAVAARDPF